MPLSQRFTANHRSLGSLLGLGSLHIFACNAANELNSKRVILAPYRTALSDIIASNSQHEFVWDRGSAHTCNFRTAVRKVAQNAGAIQAALRVVDCRG
jgi:hypothetical protein